MGWQCRLPSSITWHVNRWPSKHDTTRPSDPSHPLPPSKILCVRLYLSTCAFVGLYALLTELTVTERSLIADDLFPFVLATTVLPTLRCSLKCLFQRRRLSFLKPMLRPTMQTTNDCDSCASPIQKKLGLSIWMRSSQGQSHECRPRSPVKPPAIATSASSSSSVAYVSEQLISLPPPSQKHPDARHGHCTPIVLSMLHASTLPPS